MSIQQAVNSAKRAGFFGESLVIAVAIAGAESGFNASNVSTAGNTPPSRDRGLWQINDHFHAEVSDSCAFDPDCNARAAFRISLGGLNWNAWSAYKNGTYKNFLSQSRAAVSGNATTTGGEPSPDCVANCSIQFPSILDFALPGNATSRNSCISDCQRTSPAIPTRQGGGGNGGVGGIPSCAKCSITDLGSCRDCVAASVQAGLTTIAYNVFFGLLIILGLYFIFKTQADAGIRVAVNAGKEAVKTAALAAAV